MSVSLREAGYTPATAQNAKVNISSTPALVAAIKYELSHYQAPAHERAALARQKMLQVLLKGSDANALKACELVGKDREVQMFNPDTQIGVFISAGSKELDNLLQAADSAGDGT